MTLHLMSLASYEEESEIRSAMVCGRCIRGLACSVGVMIAVDFFSLHFHVFYSLLVLFPFFPTFLSLSLALLSLMRHLPYRIFYI